MKKLVISAVVAISLASGSFASILAWGEYGTVTDWNGNDGTGTAYAMIYVLTAMDAVPTFDATSGAWNMNGATYLDTKAYDASEVGGWGDPNGTDYAAVDAGSTGGAAQQYFAIFMVSENTSDLSTFVGDGKYYATITLQGEQYNIPGAGTITYYTDVSSFDDIAQGNWSQASAVPEPTTVALLALGLAAVGLKRKVA